MSLALGLPVPLPAQAWGVMTFSTSPVAMTVLTASTPASAAVSVHVWFMPPPSPDKPCGGGSVQAGAASKPTASNNEGLSNLRFCIEAPGRLSLGNTSGSAKARKTSDIFLMNCNTSLHYRAGRTVSRVTVRTTRIIDGAATLPRPETRSRRTDASKTWDRHCRASLQFCRNEARPMARPSDAPRRPPSLRHVVDGGPTIGGHRELQFLSADREDVRGRRPRVVHDGHDAAIGILERQRLSAAGRDDLGARRDELREMAEHVVGRRDVQRLR